MARKRNKKLTAVDLFCGCGGLTQGLRDADFKVIAAVDNDSLSVDTYRLNHPAVHVCETSIQDLTVTKLKRTLGLHKRELDLLAGCPPCQAFSAIRRLNGKRRIRDKESKDLVLEFLRFAEELLPKAVMMENVPWLAKDVRMRSFRRRMNRLGYSVSEAILDVADFGVPQRRRRMVFIASRVGPIDFPTPIEQDERLTVRQAIHHLTKPGASGDRLHDIAEHHCDEVMDRIRRIPKDGGSRGDLADDEQLPCHQRSDGFKDVYGRMLWDDISPTITGGCINPSKGRFLHPQQDRAITLREAALLQSFPASYAFSLNCGKYAAARMIGNALPPEFARRQAGVIASALEEKE